MSNRLVDVTEQVEAIAYGNQPGGLRAWQPSANTGPISPTRYPRVTRARKNVLLLQFMQCVIDYERLAARQRLGSRRRLMAKSKEDR